MTIPAHILEEIRHRLPVSTVVGRKVRLRKAGREWRGLSPFNAEKTPSFYANDQKQRWFDHSAGKDGDIFAFVMETEGLGFTEAVERLASEAGVDLPRATPQEQERVERQRGLAEIVEMAAAWFEAQLRSEGGAAARAYIDGRGIGRDAIQAFRIGYAPDGGRALIDHLAGKGVSPEAMLEAGLTAVYDDGRPARDKFRGRIIFPIADARGRVVGFGGRAMSDRQQPKYLNSPETPIFDKGRLLYNLHRARGPAHDLGQVYVVEGNVDVIAMDHAGFANTVAPLGTAFTAHQLDMLWSIVPEPTMVFDGDAAGRRASHKAIDLALPHLAPGRSLRFALLPPKRDPDDLIRLDGPGAMRRVLSATRPLIDMLWQREFEAEPTDTPERRAGLEARIMDACAVIENRSVQANYRSEMRRRLNALGRRASAAPPCSAALSSAALAIMSRPIRIEDDAVGLAEEQRIAAELAEMAEA